VTRSIPTAGRKLGVVVDVYHVWWDPDALAGIQRAGSANRIHAFHISDWLVPTRDLLLDRGMMGDGRDRDQETPVRRWRPRAFSVPARWRSSRTNGGRGRIDEVLSIMIDRYRAVC
jgi:hypothetical protein